MKPCCLMDYNTSTQSDKALFFFFLTLCSGCHLGLRVNKQYCNSKWKSKLTLTASIIPLRQ